MKHLKQLKQILIKVSLMHPDEGDKQGMEWGTLMHPDEGDKQGMEWGTLIKFVPYLYLACY